MTRLINLLLYLLILKSEAIDASNNEARILILGAGASGLQAARILHDAGMDDFIIVEAADRIGGRVRGERFSNMTVQLGALWAAPKNSETARLVRYLDLDRHTSDFEGLTIRNETGHDVTAEADDSYEILEEAMEKLQELRTTIRASGRTPDMSQRSALNVGGWKPKSAIDYAIEWFCFDFEYGEPVEMSSVRETLDEPDAGIDYIVDDRGFPVIFDEIAGFLNEQENLDHVRLNQKVVSIDHSNKISTLVTCEDGTRYIGEYVLLTFSVGVLQNNLVEFIPPLPEWKNVVINKMHMASYTNIYISFPEKFWDDSEWILYASNRRGYYPLFLNYQSEGYFPQGVPTLLVTVADEESRRIEAQSPSKTKIEIEEVLRKMYGDGIPSATDILVSDWSQNPLTMGSYSNYPVELSADCYPRLQSRVGSLFFGGEATSEDYLGFITGGLESGRREANKMLKCLANGLSKCPGPEEDSLDCKKPLF